MKRKKRIVTFPEAGHYAVALRQALNKLDVDYICYDKVTDEHLKVGIKHSPETICFCFKPMMGGIIECVEKGADTLLWFDSRGQCRARYYSWLQKTVLKRMGYNLDLVIFNGSNLFPTLKKLSKKSYPEVLSSAYYAYRVLRFIEDVEEKIRWYRPRVKNAKKIEAINDMAINRTKKIASFKELNKVKKDVYKLLDEIKVVKEDAPKVLILGEIYLIYSAFANHDLVKSLGDLGFEVHTTHHVSELVKHVLFHKYYRMKMERVTKNYLSVDIGGHSRESLMELLLRKDKGYIGIIHIGPFGCMPEVTVNPILQKVAKDNNIPYLFLTFDVQTSQTGLLTRLEAFSDLVKGVADEKGVSWN